MGLTPRPTDQAPLLSESDLDELLQTNMRKTAKNPNPKVFINPTDYTMNKDEIIDAGRKAGYTIEVVPGLSGELIKFS